MTLDEVKALRPQGDDSASIGAAILRAEAAQEAALSRAEELERQMAASLLIASDEDMEKAERDAALAKRGADRIGILLEELKTKLAEAQQREEAEDKAALVAEAVRLDTAFVKAWEKHFLPLTEAAAKILVAKREADAVIGQAQRALRVEVGLGDTPLPRHAWRQGEGMYREVWLASNRLDQISFVLRLAELAPSEIARREEENRQHEAREREKRAREEAERAVKAAEYRAQMAREAAEEERKRQARTIPHDYVRVPATITGGAGR